MITDGSASESGYPQLVVDVDYNDLVRVTYHLDAHASETLGNPAALNDYILALIVLEYAENSGVRTFTPFENQDLKITFWEASSDLTPHLDQLDRTKEDVIAIRVSSLQKNVGELVFVQRLIAR